MRFVEGTRYLRIGGLAAGFVNSPIKFLKRLCPFPRRESSLDGWDHAEQAGFTWDWGFGQQLELGSNNLVVQEGEDI